MQPDHSFLDALTETCNRVEPALVVDDPASMAWDAACDVLVVGVGLAGAAAALRATEDRSLSIIAIDRAAGGGASQLSGGVVYMGGGTKAQAEAGIADTPENMARYLKFETGDVVRDDTLLRFAQASRQFQPWLEQHGARFGGPATAEKTSYPYDASLYFSGNETTPAGRALATPAQRGHRARPPKGGEPKKLSGAYLLPPLLASLCKQPNVRLFRQTRATRLIVDRSGAVVGLEVRQVPPGLAAWRHAMAFGLSNNLIMSVLQLTGRLRRAITSIEQSAVPMRIRVDRGIVLSAGGFAYNRQMLGRTAPDYLLSAPLGTIADDGSGIKLGMTAGGKADMLERISAWKFLYPPASWTKACSIGPDGERLVSEEFYGARTGEAVFGKAGGKGWLILDNPLQSMVRAEVRQAKKMLFQKVQFRAIFKDYTVSAPTLLELARRIGVPEEALVATISSYNARIEAGEPDPLGKSETLRRKIETGPFYATDIGAALRLAPIPALTMGGLVVDEDTGQVMGTDGRPVERLYAAGRTAIGICSNYYVSGLSLADCIWSGWRAAEALKGNGGARALGQDAVSQAVSHAVPRTAAE